MSSNQTRAKTVNTIQAVNMALDEAMGLDPNVILLGEDIADGQEGGIVGVTKGLSTKYGSSRVRSTPISEQAIIGAAIGAAIVGMRPVAEIMLMNFTTVAMDMIVNHAAKFHYMFGGDFLVAPIHEDRLTRTVSLPSGRWRYLFDDRELLQGPARLEVSIAFRYCTHRRIHNIFRSTAEFFRGVAQ